MRSWFFPNSRRSKDVNFNDAGRLGDKSVEQVAPPEVVSSRYVGPEPGGHHPGGRYGLPGTCPLFVGRMSDFATVGGCARGCAHRFDQSKRETEERVWHSFVQCPRHQIAKAQISDVMKERLAAPA